MNNQAAKLQVYSLDGLELPFPDDVADKVQVHVQPEISADDLAELFRTMLGKVAIVVRSKTKLTDEHASILRSRTGSTDPDQDLSPRKLCLVRAGVDGSSISKKFDALGVPVLTTPTANRISTANCAVRALQFVTNPHLQQNPDTLENRGRQQYSEGGHDKLLWDETKHTEIYGDAPVKGTVGFVGAGPIALRAAARVRELGGNPVFWNRTKDKPALAPYEVADHVTDLAERCDSISLHLPGVPETSNIIDERFWDSVPDGKRMNVVNFGRGSLVNERALHNALADTKRDRIGMCVLDTLTIEGKRLMRPIGSKEDLARAEIQHLCDVLYPLLRHPNVRTTFHSGPETTTNKQQNAAEVVAHLIREFELRS